MKTGKLLRGDNTRKCLSEVREIVQKISGGTTEALIRIK